MLTSNFGSLSNGVVITLVIKADECASFDLIYPSGFRKKYSYPYTNYTPEYETLGGVLIDVPQVGLYQIIAYSSLEDSEGKQYIVSVTPSDDSVRVNVSFLDSSVVPSIDTDNGNLVLISETSEIKFFEDDVIDICLVGAGGRAALPPGGASTSVSNVFGGNGGEVINYYKYPVKAGTNYSIIIGKDLRGGEISTTTSAFGITTSEAPDILPYRFKYYGVGLPGIFIFNNPEYLQPGASGGASLESNVLSNGYPQPGGTTGGGMGGGSEGTYYGAGAGGKYGTLYADSNKPFTGYQGAVWIRKSVEEYYPIGGRIFYDVGDNGVTYTFYDAEYNIITDQTISGLSNAKYYSYNKMASTTPRRWYVYDTEGLSGSSYKGGFSSSVSTYMSITLTDTISYGPYYTNLGINFTLVRNPSNCFDYIKQKNEEKYMGCADWFMGSSLEQDILRNLGWVDWYNGSTLIHSSTLLSGFNSYWTGSKWAACAADTSARCFLMRSF